MQIPALQENESTLIREKWKLAGAGRAGRGYGRLRVCGSSLAESLPGESLPKLILDLTQPKQKCQFCLWKLIN